MAGVCACERAYVCVRVRMYWIHICARAHTLYASLYKLLGHRPNMHCTCGPVLYMLHVNNFIASRTCKERI